MLVAEGHWFKRQNRFARLVHRFNRFLESRRGGRDAQFTIRVYDYLAASHWHARDTGDKGGCVSSSGPDMDAVGCARVAWVADTDIIIASIQVFAGSEAHRDVVAAAGVATKCVKTNRRVVIACGVKNERIITVSRVLVAVCISLKRGNAGRGVQVAGRIRKEREGSAGCVKGPGRI